MKIGFIGLGIMGRPMAKNLVRAGHELYVNDHHQDAVDDLVSLGATAVEKAAQAAEAAELVITMLPNSPQVKEVALGPGGIIGGTHEGLVHVDMSSIAPLVSREVHDALAAAGIAMLDAPVSGGEPGAIEGSLAFMVGGPEDVFAACKPVLEVMGSSVTRVGGLGAGNTTKLANQIIVAVNIAALSEALVLAKRAGVDPRAVVAAIRGGLAGSKVLEQKAEKMLADEFSPGFRIDLHIKDLNNALDTGHTVGATLPLTAAAREMMTAIAANGHLRDDHSSLLTYYEKLTGARLSE